MVDDLDDKAALQIRTSRKESLTRELQSVLDEDAFAMVAYAKTATTAGEASAPIRYLVRS